jgi:hypothetical protein
MMSRPQDGAMLALQTCQEAVCVARESALSAATGLAGARRTRAEQLAEKLADAICYVERLSFVCLCDAASAAHEARVTGEGA